MCNPPGSKPTDRRGYIKYLGSAAVAGALAGCSIFETREDGDETPTPTPDAERDAEEVQPPSETDGYPYESEYETVVDVAEAGADTSGEEPMNDVIEENLADDTMFFFPEGEYLLSGLLVVQHYANVGFVGENAVLRPEDGAIGHWIVFDDASDLQIEGLTIDNSADQTGVRMSIHVTGGHNVMRGVEVRGFQDIEERTHAFTLQCNGATTLLRFVDVVMTDGALNGTAVFIHPGNDPGTIGFEDCQITNWYEQGLYGSPHGGTIYVVGGYYADNGMSQVRVSGGNIERTAIVKGVTVEVSDPHPANLKGNTRGIWLKEGDGILVDDCDITVSELSDRGSAGALVVGPECGRTTVRNTNIQVDDSTFALFGARPKDSNFVTPSMDRPPESWEITAENLTVTGDAANQAGIWIVDRPNCTFENLEIQHTGENRAGFGVLESPGLEIHDFSCVTADYPLLAYAAGDADGCDLSVSNVRRIESAVDGEPDATVSPEGEDDYCLTPETFGVTEDRPVLGLTGQNGDGLEVTTLPEDEMNRY